jgi:hypothetical protein
MRPVAILLLAALTGCRFGGSTVSTIELSLWYYKHVKGNNDWMSIEADGGPYLQLAKTNGQVEFDILLKYCKDTSASDTTASSFKNEAGLNYDFEFCEMFLSDGKAEKAKIWASEYGIAMKNNYQLNSNSNGNVISYIKSYIAPLDADGNEARAVLDYFQQVHGIELKRFKIAYGRF